MKKILNNKYIIIFPILLLNIISLIYLKNTVYFKKQLIILIIGYILLFLTSKINYKFIFKLINIAYIISILLLILVLIIGKEINGSKAWINFSNFSIQPSEICKITLILMLTKENIKRNSLLNIFLLTIIPAFLTFVEPDTGAIIIYTIIFLSQLKYIKNKKKIIYPLFILIGLFITINYYLYKTNQDLLSKIYGANIFYRIDRIISFKNQDNIQNTNSLISIGSRNLIYIPENHNDFIYASILSKYHLIIFTLITISSISIFIYYLKNISNKKNISNIINTSILNMLFFQILYNTFMNLSLLPIIGIPYPFLSYGGSYIITLYFIIGLSINLNKHISKKVDNKNTDYIQGQDHMVDSHILDQT